jgi:hypothetical protein
VLSAFDGLGALAVALFLGLVAVDRSELRWTGDELDLRVAPEELAAGFREGRAWQAIYGADGQKLGWVRVDRRRHGDGFELATHTVLAAPSEAVVSTRVRLGAGFELQEVDARARGPAGGISARGSVRHDVLELAVEGPLGPAGLRLPARELVFDASWRPLVTAHDLTVGRRFAFDRFDPVVLGTRRVVVEYLGREDLVIMGEVVSAHHLRQQTDGQVLEAWVDDLGEALREELPGGLSAVRETEAQATFGIREPGP